MSLKLEYVLEINATPDAIWRVFEHIEEWPRWDADSLKSVRWVSGEPWTQGARFEMQIARPIAFTLTPEIIEVAAPVYVHIKGSGSGVTGEQHYIFQWDPERNLTEARTLQEFSGMAVAFAGNRVKQAILDGIAHMFNKIKCEAEAVQAPVAIQLPPSSLEQGLSGYAQQTELHVGSVPECVAEPGASDAASPGETQPQSEVPRTIE